MSQVLGWKIVFLILKKSFLVKFEERECETDFRAGAGSGLMIPGCFVFFVVYYLIRYSYPVRIRWTRLLCRPRFSENSGMFRR